MHFLIDANLPRSARALFVSRSQKATDVRDIGLGSADDKTIAAYAKANQMVMVTRDGVLEMCAIIRRGSIQELWL